MPVQQHDTMTPGLAAAIPPASAVNSPPQVEARSSLSPLSAALPLWLWPVAIVLAMLGLATANPMLTAVGILAGPLLVTLLWRSGEPPILLACCLMQWLQVMVPIFYADLVGNSLSLESMELGSDRSVVIFNTSGFSNQAKATWLSLGGILAMAVGMRLALKHRLGSAASQIERELKELSLPRIFYAYLAGFGLSSVCNTAAWYLGGLAQLVLAVGVIKWVMLWILCCCAFVQAKGYRFVLVALALEVGVGFLSFFASYKEAFFVLGIAMFSVRGKLSTRVRLGLGCAVAGLLCMMIFWQAVKMEYRVFLSGGTAGYSTGMSVGEQVRKLGQLLASLDAETIEIGIGSLVSRVGYTELFAATLEWVPANEPHAGGELWKGAVLHPFMPRLLFPNKETLDDSLLTRRFTGLAVSGSESGTSIGIGIMAESYADFGATLMFLPLLLLGYLFGRIYRAFSGNPAALVWGTALGVGVLFSSMRGVEVSGIKLLGGVLTTSLVLFAIDRFFGRGIFKFLGGGRATGAQPQLR